MSAREQPSEFLRHPLAPVYDAHSRVLILGTMPSPKSREQGFYYAHPQNRFWPLIAGVLQQLVPMGTAARRQFALENGIALWDVLASCRIQGADDGSIREPVANDLRPLLEAADICAVFTTGRTAFRLYQRLCQPQTGRRALYLPSPSAANCRFYTPAQLEEAYRAILPFLTGTADDTSV